MSDGPQTILPQLVLVEAGEFVMGCDARSRDERPAHLVRLLSFRAAAAPVTNEQYGRFVSLTGAAAPRFADDPTFNPPEQPVVGLSWFEAMAYCEWLAAQTGTSFRLPTEAEREYAALGGLDRVDWPWSVTPDAEHPLAGEIGALEHPHVPGEACANGYGLRCVAENVHEWCSDWYAADYYETSPVDSPSGPPTAKRKASRGGSWRHEIKFTRITARSAIPPEFRYNDFGFRVYADAEA